MCLESLLDVIIREFLESIVVGCGTSGCRQTKHDRSENRNRCKMGVASKKWWQHLINMTAEELRKAQQEQPFVPFNVHMANGRTFSVPHPDFFALHPNGRIVVVFEEGGG